MSSCHTFRPVPGQCGPRGRGPLPAPPFDPQDYWATRKLVSSLVGALETSKLDRTDVVDPSAATEDGKAADAKRTQEEIDSVLGVASGALALAESKADKLSSRQLDAVNSGIDAAKVAKIAQNEIAISEEVSRATTEEARLRELVNAIKTFDAVVADSLPDPSEQYSRKLYLVPSTNPETRNVRDEFICVKIGDSWSWEQVGSTAVTIEFDNEPTEGSQKAARSGGIWSFVNGIVERLTLGWEKITGKPSTFPPSEHSHAQSQVTGLAGALAEKLPSTLSNADALSVENPDPLALPIPMIEYTVLDLVTAKKGWRWNGYTEFSNLRGKPTTLAGYGITDAATKADVDAKANSADIQGMVRETMSAEGISGSGIYIGGSVRGQTISDQYGDLREAINGKADKTIPSKWGNLSALAEDGNLIDSYIDMQDLALKNQVNWMADADSGFSSGQGDGFFFTIENGEQRLAVLKGRVIVDRDGKDAGERSVAMLGDISALSSSVSALESSKADRASIAPEYSATSAYSVGSIVYHDGSIYQCKTAIADGGEAWNADHWDLRKLDGFFTESNSLLTGTIDAEVISKGTAPDAHLEAPTDEHLKLILADNSVAYDSAKALPYKLTSAIGDRVIATMTLTAASTDITLPTITANDTTVKDFILDVTNAYAVEGVATDAGINIPRTDFKLVTRDGESLTDVTTVKAGKSAFICFTQKSPVVVDGTTYPCWCVIQLPFGDPS